jgi:hypothetical protein
VFIGPSAGYNQTTLSDRLIINNRDEGSAAAEITDSLIYGIFDAAPANQSVRINGSLIVSQGSVTHSSSTVTAAGPTDNVDVADVNIVFIDTNGNNVTIGGFVNGVDGQVIRLVVEDASNNSVLEHNEGTGNQDIFLSSGGDETLTAAYGGWILVCNGTHWYEVDN